jgi:hypothetical protein
VRATIGALSLIAVAFVCALRAEGFWLPNCTPTTKNHERWPVKTHKTPKEVHAREITVAGLIAEDLPAVTGLPNTSLAGTDAENLYAWTAFVMLVKRGSEDCDIHMEVADTADPSAPRVIVEVPPTFPPDQARMAKLLGLKTISASGKKFTAANAKQLHFLGYGFFDLPHHASGGDKTGESHGSFHTVTKNGKKTSIYNDKTILELRPTFGILDRRLALGTLRQCRQDAM